MTSTWKNFLPLLKQLLAKRVAVAACACLAFALITAGPVLAQACPVNVGDTCPVTGISGFETGLQVLAKLTIGKNLLGDLMDTTVDWGDGQHSTGLVRCYEPFLDPSTCHVFGTHTYAAPAIYPIKIAYQKSLFEKDTANTTATISAAGDLARDFVIFSIGDSVASGEGNPVIPYGGYAAPSLVTPSVVGSQPHEGFWDDPYSNDNASPFPQDELKEWPNQSFPCHLSSIAGPAQAEQKIRSTNPGVAVIHFACSGAKINATDTANNTVQDAVGQLRVARERLPRIDLLIISAGANSLYGPNSFGNGFGDLVTYCLDPLHDCDQNANVQSDLNNSFQALPGEYEKLAKEIDCINPDDGTQEPSCTDPQNQIPKLVLITEYMDPTHDQNGNYPKVGGCPATIFNLVDQPEWQFFHDSIVHPLNQQVDNFPIYAAAAGLAVPSDAVTGIEQDFLDHGLCAGDQRWVLTLADSTGALGPEEPPSGPKGASTHGTGHPNGAGQTDYRDRIYAAMVAYNPPATTASAMAGGSAYAFGMWTDQDVELTLSANNGIKESGVKQTYYAVDNANCNFADVSDFPNNPPNCLLYSGPFTISKSGQHTVTFFSVNSAGNPEAVQSVQVWVDKNPPVGAAPGTLNVYRGQSTVYEVALGHVGWDTSVVNLSCTTDAPQGTCTMQPPALSLDGAATPTSSAVVVTQRGSMILGPAPPVRPNPFGPLGALRLLLAFATATFLAAAARAVLRHRWSHVTQFAALALLFGVLCAGCNSSAGIPGTPRGTYNVTITGTSGMTTNTTQVHLVVQ